MDIQYIIQSVKDGNGDPLEAFVLLKAIADEAEKGIEEIKSQAMSEAEKYGKSFEKFGAKIELRNAPGRYNFKGIPAIEAAEKRAIYLQELAKIGGVDEESGEVIPKAPKVEGKATIAISFLKHA